MGLPFMWFGRPKPLLPNEELVHERRRFRAVWCAALPSCGIYVPGVMQLVLRITDHRCMFVITSHFMTQEIVQWYPKRNPDHDPEIITSVSSGKGFLGPCLEIHSHNPTRRARWLWSPDLTLRFFIQDPEHLRQMIFDQITSEGAQQWKQGQH